MTAVRRCLPAWLTRITLAQRAGQSKFHAALTLTLVLTIHAPIRAQRAAPVPADDPFAKRGWHVELAAHGAVEAWNYNISREELAGGQTGFTYGLRDGLQLIAAWPMYHVWQPGVDALLVGGTFGVRQRVYKAKRWTAFLELRVGVADADVVVPPRGTRFNYLALGGGGATVRLRRGVHAMAGLEWLHISNGGIAGRDRNPDIEAVGPKVGLLLAF